MKSLLIGEFVIISMSVLYARSLRSPCNLMFPISMWRKLSPQKAAYDVFCQCWSKTEDGVAVKEINVFTIMKNIFLCLTSSAHNYLKTTAFYVCLN